MAGDDYSIADISCYPWSFAATTFPRAGARRDVGGHAEFSALAEGGRRAAGGEEGDDGAVTTARDGGRLTLDARMASALRNQGGHRLREAVAGRPASADRQLATTASRA